MTTRHARVERMRDPKTPGARQRMKGLALLLLSEDESALDAARRKRAEKGLRRAARHAKSVRA